MPNGKKFKSFNESITRILGFSVMESHVQLWSDEDGDPYDLSEILKTEEFHGINYNFLCTPRVKKEARNLFDCDDIPGAPLENQASGSYGLSLWDRRYFGNEYMTASNPRTPSYSRVSFAVLEDTGWYKIDYSYADPFYWGKDEGCDFFDDKCIDNEKASFPVFCTENPGADGQNAMCSHDHLSQGYCHKVQYSTELPERYQYFDDPTVGGGSNYTDFCPIVNTYANGDCRDAANNVSYESQVGEYFSVTSRCFDATINNESNAVCLQVLSCEGTSKVRFKFGQTSGTFAEITNKEFQCSEGETVKVAEDFVINCPKANLICAPMPCLNKCFGAGTCTSGICNCEEGTSGDDCANGTPVNQSKSTTSTGSGGGSNPFWNSDDEEEGDDGFANPLSLSYVLLSFMSLVFACSTTAQMTKIQRYDVPKTSVQNRFSISSLLPEVGTRSLRSS
jgi:hypothetical protein